VISIMTMSSRPMKMSLKLANKPGETNKSEQTSQAAMAEKMSDYDGSRKAFDKNKDSLNRINSFSMQQFEKDNNGDEKDNKPQGQQFVDKRVPYKPHGDHDHQQVSNQPSAETTTIQRNETEMNSGRSKEDFVSMSADKAHVDVGGTGTATETSTSRATPRSQQPQANESLKSGAKNDAAQNALESARSAASGMGSPTPSMLTRTNSFAEKAFTSASVEEKDTVLLMGSTWVAMLIAGIESVPLAFSLLSADPKHYKSDKTIFPFVYVNAKFEIDYGYVRENIIGRSYKYLFRKTNKTAEKSARVNPNSLNLGDGVSYVDVDDDDLDERASNCDELGDQDPSGQSNDALTEAQEKAHKDALDQSLLEARGKVIDVFFYRGNGKKIKTIICTKPIFDQKNNFRYMMCLSVCMHENTKIGAAAHNTRTGRVRNVSKYQGSNNSSVHGGNNSNSTSSNEGRRKKAEREMVRQVDFAMLVDLMDSLPNKFEDMNLH
jgi:hypothetical protein